MAGLALKSEAPGEIIVHNPFDGALVHGSFKGGDVVGLGGNNPAD